MAKNRSQHRRSFRKDFPTLCGLISFWALFTISQLSEPGFKQISNLSFANSHPHCHESSEEKITRQKNIQRMLVSKRGNTTALARDHRIRGAVGGGGHQHCETFVSAMSTPAPQTSEEKIDYQNIQHMQSFVKGGGRGQPCETAVSTGLSPDRLESEEKIDQKNIRLMEPVSTGGGRNAALSRDPSVRGTVGGGEQLCETLVSALPTPTLPTCSRPVTVRSEEKSNSPNITLTTHAELNEGSAIIAQSRDPRVRGGEEGGVTSRDPRVRFVHPRPQLGHGPTTSSSCAQNPSEGWTFEQFEKIDAELRHTICTCQQQICICITPENSTDNSDDEKISIDLNLDSKNLKNGNMKTEEMNFVRNYPTSESLAAQVGQTGSRNCTARDPLQKAHTHYHTSPPLQYPPDGSPPPRSPLVRVCLWRERDQQKGVQRQNYQNCSFRRMSRSTIC